MFVKVYSPVSKYTQYCNIYAQIMGVNGGVYGLKKERNTLRELMHFFTRLLSVFNVFLVREFSFLSSLRSHE